MTKRQKYKFDEAIGFKVRWARREMMMLRDDLAQALLSNTAQIERFEHGLEPIPAQMLSDIARVLHKPITWFFEDISHSIDVSCSIRSEAIFKECIGYLVVLRDHDALEDIRSTLERASKRFS